MQSQFDYEYQLKPRIDQYHRDAVSAEQIRIARANRTKRITEDTMKRRVSIGAMLITAKSYFRRGPGVSLELDAKPADTGVTA